MTPISTSSLVQALTWRYATKKFDPARKIPAEIWDAIEETLRLSPSSYGLQPWKFLVIDNPAIREMLVDHSWGQRQVADASHFVVFAAKQTITEADIQQLIHATAAARAIPPETLDFYKNMMVGDLLTGPRAATIPEWSARQVYLALGNLLTSAALLGIDACPMEGFDPAKYDEVLGLAGGDYRSAVACALGYRANSDNYAGLAKIRYPREVIIQHVS